MASASNGLARDALRVFEEHLAAFNAYDTERVLATFATDAVWTTGQDRVQGTVDLADLFDPWLWSLLPQLTARSVTVGTDVVAAELSEELTVDGARRTMNIAVFFTIQDGVIVEGRVYREGSADLA